MGVIGDLGSGPDIVGVDLGIGVVKIIVAGVGADDPASLLHKFGGFPVVAHPVLDDEMAGERAAGQALVVDDDLLALFRQVVPRLEHKPTLQFLLIFQALLPDAPLAVRAAPPVELQGFVPADVDIGAGEEVRHLVQNVQQEPEGVFPPGAEQVGEDAAGVQHPVVIGVLRFRQAAPLKAFPPAAELGISCQHGAGVAGDLDLWDDLDAQGSGVVHHLANLVLGIIAAVVLCLGNIAEIRAAPPAAHLGQAGIFFDFQPPALVVGQVPVHGVQTAQGRGIQKRKNIRQLHIVAADIQHEAQIGGVFPFHGVSSFPWGCDAPIIKQPQPEYKCREVFTFPPNGSIMEVKPSGRDCRHGL